MWTKTDHFKFYTDHEPRGGDPPWKQASVVVKSCWFWLDRKSESWGANFCINFPNMKGTFLFEFYNDYGKWLEERRTRIFNLLKQQPPIEHRPDGSPAGRGTQAVEPGQQPDTSWMLQLWCQKLRIARQSRLLNMSASHFLCNLLEPPPPLTDKTASIASAFCTENPERNFLNFSNYARILHG